MRYKASKFCRLCKSKKLTTILKLTPTPWADDFRVKNKLHLKQPLVPLNINLCNKCKHAQLSHVMEAQDIYLNYTYETASSPTLKAHFKSASSKILQKFKPEKNGLVVDIGSNDGMLLSFFKKKGMQVLGIDPMPGIANKANKKGIKTLSKFFSAKYSKTMSSKFGKASIITANNLVADTDNLDEFVRGVKNLMDEKSLFIFESFYFYLQMKNFVWDFTYHEHYSYFTITALNKYFKSMNMEIVDVEAIDTKGGSMRCAVQLKNGSRNPNKSVKHFINAEKKFGYPKKELFLKYSKKIDHSKKIFTKEIAKLLIEGKKISAYGASATSTTLMYHYNMKFLKSIYDDFKIKQNTFSPGFHIPVYDPKKIYKDKPDYIIILAWRYKNQILKRHKKYLKNTKFIVPLPNYKVLEK
jgi:hypothetical protein